MVTASSEASTWVARVQRAVLQNIGLKTFSLLVAIGLFTIVHGSATGQRTIDVPVVAILPPASSNKVLVGDIPEKVKLTLSGSRSVLNSIGSTLDSVQIDLSDGAHTFYFEPDSFGLPAGIEVHVTPPSLSLAWETRLERTLPLRAQLSGAADPSLELASKTVTPQKVTVSGPRSLVEAMLDVTTEPVPVTGLGEGTHRRRVPIMQLPKNVTASQTGDVTVEVTLEAKRAQRRLRRLPVAVVGVPGVLAVRPLHVDVVVAAPEGLLEELDPEHVVPVAEVSGANLGAGAISVPVKVRGLNEGVRVLRIEPSEVLVRGR